MRMYRPITEPMAPAAMMPHGFGFHLTMINARMVHAGGANTGIVSTRRAVTNAARYSTTDVIVLVDTFLVPREPDAATLGYRNSHSWTFQKMPVLVGLPLKCRSVDGIASSLVML